MRGQAADLANIAEKKTRMMEAGFRLFSEKGIELVKMQEIAEACDVPRNSMYRYYPSKLDLVVAISAYMWEAFSRKNYPLAEATARTAAERYEFWLNSFLMLYREHRDILRFNQFFNVYLANEQYDGEKMKPFVRVIDELAERFHALYVLGEKDGTFRTEIPENEVFSTTLHLMLAAVTRYAIGLVYMGGNDPEAELTGLKEMLMQRYTVSRMS